MTCFASFWGPNNCRGPMSCDFFSEALYRWHGTYAFFCFFHFADDMGVCVFWVCPTTPMSSAGSIINKISRNARSCLHLEIFPSRTVEPPTSSSVEPETTAHHWRPKGWDGAALRLRLTPGRARALGMVIGGWFQKSPVSWGGKSSNKDKGTSIITINGHKWERISSKSTWATFYRNQLFGLNFYINAVKC